MKTLRFFILLFIGTPLFAFSPPDEGMWLPMFIKDYNYSEMKRLGCKLTPEQIYSVNQSCLKDAIVQLGSFCTAEVISDQGLILTNHHCAYDAIASQSTEEHNYLKTGFWAMNKGQELNIPGLSVTFLKRMDDVTERMMKLDKSEDGSIDYYAIEEEKEVIREEMSDGGKYEVEVKAMFNGNAFYVFIYEVYNDIRLVGAPPSSIGKFGGDTDNWQWPRHTGDFSMFRIYAGPNNEPARYSSANKPLKPRHSLPISLKGINEGDFTMVLGYPGSTDRYLTSYEVENLQKVDAPILVDLLKQRLDIMREVMDRSEKLEIQYASNYASLSNTYKYYKGQILGLNKFDLVGQKKKYEAGLEKWIKQSPERTEKYGTLLADFEKVHRDYPTIDPDLSVVNLAGFAPEFVIVGISVYRLQRVLGDEDQPEALLALTDIVSEKGKEYFEGNNQLMDFEIFQFTLDALKKQLSPDRQPDIFQHKMYTKKAKGSNERYAQLVLKKSIFGNPALMEKFLKNPTQKVLDKDPGMIYVNSLIQMFQDKIRSDQMMKQNELERLKHLYMQMIQEKEKTQTFYPDADFTMRVTYGTVQKYKDWNGSPYETFTSGDQILDKYKAGDSEFDVPEKLRSLISSKDFGVYARKDGKLPVCFVHNTDITGGNSGSPVINADGHLIGVAFDGNWESMTSDMYWQDDYVRTISVDIRYVMFIIDKFAGASHLLEEMKLVK